MNSVIQKANRIIIKVGNSLVTEMTGQGLDQRGDCALGGADRAVADARARRWCW